MTNALVFLVLWLAIVGSIAVAGIYGARWLLERRDFWKDGDR